MIALADVVARGLRPDSWDFPLLLHVLGAMILVGSLLLAAASLFFSWRDGNEALVRLGFRAVLLGAIPGWIAMRAGAGWIADKESLNGENIDLAWLDMGFTTADGGVVLLVITTILAGLAVRRAQRGDAAAATLGGTGRVATVLAAVLVLAYLVTVWAMTTKPT